MGGVAAALVSGPDPAGRDFRVRPMTEADLAQVVAIEEGWAPTPWSVATFRNELAVPFSRAIVAHGAATPEVVAGYLVRWRVADEMHLLDLAVAPGSRARGLGRMLVELLLDEARRRRAQRVTLEVEAKNSIAQTLYRSAGFTETHRRRGYYGPERDAVVMEWHAFAATCHGGRRVS